MISAKTLSGSIYSYPAVTAFDFKTRLSSDKGIPREVLQLLVENEVELRDDTFLSPNIMYSLFCKSGQMKEWVSKIDTSKREHQKWKHLSLNPSAIHLIEQNLDKVDWGFLSDNPAAVHILEQNLDKVDWTFLSRNPAAVHILEQNLDKVVWETIGSNPSAIHLIRKNLDKINWEKLSSNPAAIHIIEEHMDRVKWKGLSHNPSSLHLLLQNPEKIRWDDFARNPNPEAISILKKLDREKVNWVALSNNQSKEAICFLKGYPEKAYWLFLIKNTYAIEWIERNKEFASKFSTLFANPAIFYPHYEL